MDSTTAAPFLLKGQTGYVDRDYHWQGKDNNPKAAREENGDPKTACGVQHDLRTSQSTNLSSSADPSTADLDLPIPKGWSNKPHHMDYNVYWAGKDGDLKHELGTYYGLTAVRPLCAIVPSSGDVLYLFQSESKYYLRNDIEDLGYSIEKPERLEDIDNVISRGDGRLNGLKMKALIPKDGAVTVPD